MSSNRYNDQLRGCGLDDVDVEVPVGDQYPDVYGHRDGRGYAVEIQWSALDYETARQRIEGLEREGCQVLWPTHRCDWIERLPALGIASFDPETPDYVADIGYLAIGSASGGLEVEECSARSFLSDWTTENIAWGYRASTTEDGPP